MIRFFRPSSRQLALLVLPVCFVITTLILRLDSGPFWLWSNLDPDYWYLLDSLNLLNFNWPQHIAHPGTTVQTIGAIVIKALHPLIGIGDLTTRVLGDPERYLGAVGHILVIINGIALAVAGLLAHRVFNSLTAALLVQTGPFLSRLMMKHMIHVSPEPLLVTTVLLLACVVLLALRPGQMARHPGRYAIAFAAVAGFGLATKITSAGIYLLPVFLLARPRNVAIYAVSSAFFLVFFTLPAAGSYGLILDWVTMIASGSGHFGEGSQTFINLADYPGDLRRVASRPVYVFSLVAGLALTFVARRRAVAQGIPLSPATKALAGLCLALAAQAVLVAKHPAGHYMIPALVACGFGFALILQVSREILVGNEKTQTAVNRGFTLLLATLVVSQGMAVVKLDREFSGRATRALEIDEQPFAACARIYFWPTSSPHFALHLASFMTGKTFTAELRALYPDPNILFVAPDKTISNWNEDVKTADLPGKYPCVISRSTNFEYFEPPAPLPFVLPYDYSPFYAYQKMSFCLHAEEAIIGWGISVVPENRKCENALQ